MNDGRIPLPHEANETADEQPASSQPKGDITSPISDSIEVPYNDYHKTHGKPYLVEHFKLGDTWDDPSGGFPFEIAAINNYVQSKIDSGDTPNSISGVKNLLREMEKFNNLQKEERAVVKLEILSHYVEFMLKNDNTRSNLRRYRG